MRDLLIFIFILKTTGTFTPVHSAGYLILRNEFRSTQEIARQNIQVSFYIRSTGLLPNTCVTIFGNNQKRNAHFVTRQLTKILPLRVEGMYKEYIQTTYTSQIDKNIIRTEIKMQTNYATRD